MVWDPTLRGLGAAEKAAADARRKRAAQRTAGEKTAAAGGFDPRTYQSPLAVKSPYTPKNTAFQWGDLSNLGPPAEPAFQWGDLDALQAIQDADTAATTTDHRFVDPFAELEAMDAFVPSGTGGLGLSPEVSDFLTSLGGTGDMGVGTGDMGDGGAAAAAAAAAAEAARVAAEEAEALRQAGLDAEAEAAEIEAARLADLAARQQACAAQEGGVWNAATEQCDITGAGDGSEADPFAAQKAACAQDPNGMWNPQTNTCVAIHEGAGAFDPNVGVDPAIEAQAADQMSIVEKTLQTKNRSIQQALQAGLLSISDAQTAWDEARSEIYQDFLTEQGLIQSGFATEQEETASRRTTERDKLITALNAAGVDSGLVADELAMIDEMFQGGATEQKDYLDAMGRIGEMSNADRRMMGQGIFGGYEQNLRSGMRDLGLATNFEGADQSQLARERGLQALGMSDFTGVDPETLYAALYAGVDVPGMAYGTSEREASQIYGTGERVASQEWAEGESELDRALATDKFNESVRQFNWLGGRQDAATRTGISQFNKQFAREGEQYDTAQTQYQDALDLEAGQYATGREDIAAALGLEAERFELGRDMGSDPESLYIGMTSAQKLEHQRLTAAALKSAGADVSRGSFLSRVASTMLLTGYEATEISELQDQIDGYLADNMRGDDLSDENVLAALLWLGKTDIAMGALQGLSEEQLEGLADAMSGGGAGGTTGGASTTPPYAPDVGQAESETISPEGQYGIDPRPGEPDRQLRDDERNLTTGERLQGTRLKPVTGSGMMGQGSRSENIYRDTVGNSFTQAEVDRIAASMPPGWTDPAYEPGPLGYIDYVARIGWVFDETGKAGEEVSRLTPSGGGQLGLGRFG